MILIILLILLVLVAIYAIATYNSFIRLDEMVSNAMGQIATGLQARWDALNNLIDMSKDYKEFEVAAFDKITANRTGVDRNSSVREVEEDQKNFQKALSGFYAVAENYPNLKTSEIYQKTMDSIDNHEDKIRHLRMIYNDTVTKYNRKIKTFPANIFAGIFNQSEKSYFENTEQSMDAPRFRG